MNKLLILLGLILSMSATFAAQQSKPCSTEEYRQFDFWIGDWEVFDKDGEKVGDNKIELILAGCALQENWTSTKVNRGHSFNIYDAATSSWHQTWVDNGGTLLQLDGGLEADDMVLMGVSYTPKGPVQNRIRWTPKDNEVLQVWDISKDGGKNWQTIFSGLYKKK